MDKFAYKIDVRVYASIKVNELPILLPPEVLKSSSMLSFDKKLDTTMYDELPPGYKELVINMTEDEVNDLVRWANRYPDFKIIGVTKLSNNPIKQETYETTRENLDDCRWESDTDEIFAKA